MNTFLSLGSEGMKVEFAVDSIVGKLESMKDETGFPVFRSIKRGLPVFSGPSFDEDIEYLFGKRFQARPRKMQRRMKRSRISTTY